MSDYIDAKTDFGHVVISNDNPCIVGGRWAATLVNGKVVYTNIDTNKTLVVNGENYSGPVNVIGASLTVVSGVKLDGLVMLSSSTSKSTLIVNAGGTVSNSTFFDATVAIKGSATDNAYVSSAVSFNPGATSTDDYFYSPPATDPKSGTLNLSQLPSGNSTTFQTSDGTGSFQMGQTSSVTDNANISINNPTFIGDISNTGTAPTFKMGAGSYVGNPALATDKNLSLFSQPRTRLISNSNKTYWAPLQPAIGEPRYKNWVAYRSDVDGKTYYRTSDNTVSGISGPLNLLNIANLVIENGAVADGLVLGETVGNYNAGIVDSESTRILIQAGGTLQNSTLIQGNIINQGLSQNNLLISTDYTGSTGSVSDGDVIYIAGVSSVFLSVPTPVNAPTINGKPVSTSTISTGTYPTSSSFTLSDGSVFNSYMSVASSEDLTKNTSNKGQVPGYTVTILPGATVTNPGSVTCFLAGTMIETVDGLVAIEDIQVGDQVKIYHNNQQKIESIVWVGYNHVNVKTYLPEDEAGYPVRILQDAIATGVPSKDLLITSEHSIFINGQLIPARMLVNGSTIFYDHNITSYTFYHIETKEHSIISADNVLTESYLDTGNRSSFIYNRNIVSIVNKKKEWNIDSAALLVTNKSIVEPIFKQLAQRAVELGFDITEQAVLTTNDSALQLFTNSGEILEPTYHNNGRFFFKILEDVTEVQLISRTCKASRSVGPFVDDRRDLGVLVGAVNLLEKNNTTSITEHFTAANLQGWDVQEATSCRWTNGSAKLTIKKEPSKDTGMLVIQVLAAGPYIVENKTAEQKVA